MVLVNLLQAPGKITFDTKLDLLLNPGDFMQRSLHMWNSEAAFGGVQNQASGFLFPMGPFFWLAQHVGLSVWVSERVWTALVMLVAYVGMRRLASAWGGLGSAGSVLAALAYMLAPRMISEVGVLSGEELITAILPWTVLPLLLHLRGRMRRGTALFLSAGSVPFMGGQNATEVIAALAFPFLLLLIEQHRQRWRMLAAWVGLTVLACVWWLAPLVQLGRYSPPFLNFIEAAANTTGPIGWLAALRGTTHWVAYLGPGVSGWTAGHDLVSSPILLVVTTVVALIGLLGMLCADMQGRRTLIVAVLLGMIVLTMGSADFAGSPLREVWRQALDGPLAPFRNIHKFDPVVRLPLALGVGMAAQVGSRWLQDRLPGPRARRPELSWLSGRRIVAPICGVLVVAMAGPAFAGSLRDDRPFSQIPSYWTAAAHYLGRLPSDTKVLVLPGSGFAVQTWGRTTDEVLQALDVVPYAVRNQTPIAPAGEIRTLDSVEALLESGRPSAGLAPLLRRLGITEVVVRNDLDLSRSDAPPPARVHAVLDASHGLRRLRSFGNAGNGYPGVEVYGVRGRTAGASVTSEADVLQLSGGPGALLPALSLGMLRPGTATVSGSSGDRALVTDTYQRVERTFGRVHQATSAPMTASDRFRLTRPAHDYPLSGQRRSVVEYGGGLADITASSSTGYADTPGPVRPDEGPYAALDGNVFTAWRSAPYTQSRGQWIQLRFAHPRPVPSVSLSFDTKGAAEVRRVRVDTAGGSRSVSVDEGGRTGSIRLPASPTRTLRVTVTGVDPTTTHSQVAIAELGVQGLSSSRALVVPEPVSRSDSLLLTATPPSSPCVIGPSGTSCSSGFATAGSGRIDRAFGVNGSGRFRMFGEVVALGGQGVADLFRPFGRRPVSVYASSWYDGSVGADPSNALDGDPWTAWFSAAADGHPVLDLRWGPRRRVSRIRVSTVGALSPSQVVVTGGGRRQTVSLRSGSLGVIRPVSTRHLRLRFSGPHGRPLGGSIGVAELHITGLGGLTYAPSGDTSSGAPCGFGPVVSVQGHRIQTRIRGTVGDIRSGRPLKVVPCRNGPLRLHSGRARLVVADPAGWATTAIALEPRSRSPYPSRQPQVRVRDSRGGSQAYAVSASSASVLALPQEANAGWSATLHGKRLRPVTVDTWRQGWRLPAGADGVVRMSFSGQGVYAAGLGAGLALVLLIWVGAFASLGRRGRAGGAPPTVPPAGPGRASTRPRARVAVRALAPWVAGLASPPLGVGLALSLWTDWFDRVRASWVVALLVLVAAIIAATQLATSTVAPGVSDALVAAAVGVWAGSQLGPRRRKA